MEKAQKTKNGADIKPIDSFKSPKSDDEIKKYIDDFEMNMRKKFEKSLTHQKKTLESLLKKEQIVSKKKDREVVLMFIDTGTLMPLYLQSFPISDDTNFYELQKTISEGVEKSFDSKDFQSIQNKAFLRLRSLGFKSANIYSLIEPRYDNLDSKGKRNVRNRFRELNKRKNQKKGNKTLVSLPRSEPSEE